MNEKAMLDLTCLGQYEHVARWLGPSHRRIYCGKPFMPLIGTPESRTLRERLLLLWAIGCFGSIPLKYSIRERRDGVGGR